MEFQGLMLLLEINFQESMVPISSKSIELFRYLNGERNKENKGIVMLIIMNLIGFHQIVRIKDKDSITLQIGLLTVMSSTIKKYFWEDTT